VVAMVGLDLAVVKAQQIDALSYSVDAGFEFAVGLGLGMDWEWNWNWN
jgi:hypothetical protein